MTEDDRDSNDILHQRIDTINRQLDAIMDTIQQMAKVIQLLQPVTKTIDDLELIVDETMNELKPITEADLNQGEGGSKGGDDAGPDAEFITTL